MIYSSSFEFDFFFFFLFLYEFAIGRLVKHCRVSNDFQFIKIKINCFGQRLDEHFGLDEKKVLHEWKQISYIITYYLAKT